MIVTTQMQELLEELSVIERNEMTRMINLSANDLGNELIVLYYSRTQLKTRQIIKEFLTLAGVVWLRKLLTKDTDPVVSSQGRFASLNDYISLLAANDESQRLASNF